MMLKQSFSEVIVVDYGCEQGTGSWVPKEHPSAKLVEVKDDPTFCVARARNIGAAKASKRFLCFADADVLINMDLGEWCSENARTQAFYLNSGRVRELHGFVICSKESFEKIGGYDEAFRGWGSEDFDLYERLLAAGLARASVPDHALTGIKHGDEERQFGKNDPTYKTLIQALVVGEVYRIVKMDMTKLMGKEPRLEFRKRLFDQIREFYNKAASSKQESFVFHMDVPIEQIRNTFSKSNRRLSYQVPIRTLDTTSFSTAAKATRWS